ncbi:MAG: thymidine kinase [Candidatus Kariarchaeaceae archaeon]
MASLNTTFNRGCLEVIVGTMYSGKSKELIERGNRAKNYGGVDTYYFKPTIDTRDKEIASRNGQTALATQVETGKDILNHMKAQSDAVVIIDEAQFFDETILYAVQLLKLREFNVVIAGLDKDFRGQPFGVMPQLMALSDVAIRKIYPVCSIDGCVEDGTLPQRLRNGEPDSALSPTIVIEGSKDDIEYRPVCRLHHEVPDLGEYINRKMFDTSLEEFLEME